MTTLATTHGGLGHVATHGRANTAAKRGPVAAWIARWIENFQARQQERALAYLMELDPRVRAEVEAAAARASGDY